MGTSSSEIIAFKYHSPLKGTWAPWKKKKTDSRSGAQEVKDVPEHLVTESEEMTATQAEDAPCKGRKEWEGGQGGRTQK